MLVGYFVLLSLFGMPFWHSILVINWLIVSVFADAMYCVPTILIFNLLVAYYFLRLSKVAACLGATKVDGLAEGIEGLGVLL